ncbi:RrF2 family transcriptional regulator [Amycolatopsis nigrescens]|uniref:RrF2 family transcriptional regulator n=1 Tax=Amycolatopsis nigrescens TaxID=381445 RepID=UPI00036223C6|nr:Rrf2 family transcriptional regulator [Amycolatopsis nigrescens]
MRVSVKADYAIRVMAQLAAGPSDGPVTAASLAKDQDLPLKFLHSVLRELKGARLVRSTRGPEGGFELWRPAGEISVADVLRAIDGPLVNVHDIGLSELSYSGAAESLLDVWMATRSSLRNVLEAVTMADLAAGDLPGSVLGLAEQYRSDERQRRLRREPG